MASLSMLGQPQASPLIDFDVVGLKIVQEGVPEIGQVLEILDRNEAFTLELDFKGSGTLWGNMCNFKLDYQVEFFAEGMGRSPHPGEFDLPPITGKLVPGQSNYQVKGHFPAGINQDGVYNISAMVTFPNWNGVLGFAEGLIVQVHRQEE